MDRNILAVALGSMLLGGVAVAAYQGVNTTQPAKAAFQPYRARPAVGSTQFDAPAVARADIAPARPQLAVANLAPAHARVDYARPRLDYAQVVRVNPIRKTGARYATVIGTEPVRETNTESSPREVCDDVVVQERLPERDGNVGGTVAGALIGGLVGSRIGDGNGRKAATLGGAVAGGFIGNRIDRAHVGGRVVDRVDRQCHTVTDTARSSRVVAYNVTFRNPDGTVGTQRMGSRPGRRIRLGSDSHVVGYDVTYRYQGGQRTIRMDQRPGARLPVVDGHVVARADRSLASRG